MPPPPVSLHIWLADSLVVSNFISVQAPVESLIVKGGGREKERKRKRPIQKPESQMLCCLLHYVCTFWSFSPDVGGKVYSCRCCQYNSKGLFKSSETKIFINTYSKWTELKYLRGGFEALSRKTCLISVPKAEEKKQSASLWGGGIRLPTNSFLLLSQKPRAIGNIKIDTYLKPCLLHNKGEQTRMFGPPITELLNIL